MWKFIVFLCTILIVNCNGFLSYAFNEAIKNYLDQINVVQPDQYGYPDLFSGKIGTIEKPTRIVKVTICYLPLYK